MFSDVPVENAGVWKVKQATGIFSDPRRNARYHKAKPEFDSLFSIWIDGTVTLVKSPQWLIDNELGDCDMAVFRHMERDCLYDEAKECIKLNKDKREVIEKQVARYQQEKYPAGNGLASTRMVIRRNTPAVRRFNKLWLEEIIHYSLRDQISFNYCVWKAGVRFRYFEGDSLDGRLISSEYLHSIK